MSLLKTLLKSKVRYGAINKKVVPLFNDEFHKENRNFIEVDEEDLMEYDVETQNGIPVRFSKGFLKVSSRNYGRHTGDKKFQVEGLVEGDSFFLVDVENKGEVYKILLVTDDYVYINDPVNKGIIIKSHEELRDLKHMILAV